MTVENGELPKPDYSEFVKFPNKYERQLGWFWFKGHKVGFNRSTHSVMLPSYIIREQKGLK